MAHLWKAMRSIAASGADPPSRPSLLRCWSAGESEAPPIAQLLIDFNNLTCSLLNIPEDKYSPSTTGRDALRPSACSCEVARPSADLCLAPSLCVWDQDVPACQKKVLHHHDEVSYDFLDTLADSASTGIVLGRTPTVQNELSLPACHRLAARSSANASPSAPKLQRIVSAIYYAFRVVLQTVTLEATPLTPFLHSMVLPRRAPFRLFLPRALLVCAPTALVIRVVALSLSSCTLGLSTE